MFNPEKFEAVAMLKLSDEERELIYNDVRALTESFGALLNVDTDKVEPLVSVLDLHTILREDVSDRIISRDEILSNAQEQYDGYFVVPETLD